MKDKPPRHGSVCSHTDGFAQPQRFPRHRRGRRSVSCVRLWCFSLRLYSIIRLCNGVVSVLVLSCLVLSQLPILPDLLRCSPCILNTHFDTSPTTLSLLLWLLSILNMITLTRVRETNSLCPFIFMTHTQDRHVMMIVLNETEECVYSMSCCWMPKQSFVSLLPSFYTDLSPSQ